MEASTARMAGTAGLGTTDMVQDTGMADHTTAGVTVTVGGATDTAGEATAVEVGLETKMLRRKFFGVVF